MVKKVKCNVCNYKFIVEKEKTKQVIEPTGTSIIKNVKHYDAIDCPKCGCQKILCTRLQELQKIN